MLVLCCRGIDTRWLLVFCIVFASGGQHSFLVLLPLVLLIFLLFALSVLAKPDLFLLVPVQILILIESMLPQISHVDVNLGLICTHVVVDFANEEIECGHEVLVTLSNQILVLAELILHMVYQLLKVSLIV